MKNKLALVLLILCAAGCMQEYSESITNDGDNTKACNLVNYKSTIAVQYSAANIPTKLSASVNGMAVVNECVLGTDNSSYLTVRTADSVTVLLRLDGNAAMTEMFFNPDGSPKSNVQFQFNMKGRENCSDTPGTVYTTSRSLNWQPVYSNANKDCGPSGYTATISN